MDTNVRILIIDDDDVDRMNVGRSLKKAGLAPTITEASDIGEGLQYLSDTCFDCVFLDYLLPDGNGSQLLEKTRAAGITTPIIMLTGHGDERLAVELLRAGASDYLPKSQVSPDTLSHSLHNVMRINKAETERALAEQELRNTNDKVIKILESVSDAFFAINRDYRFTYINKQAEILLKTNRGQLMNQSIQQLMLDLPAWFQNAINQCMQQRKAVHCEGFDEKLGKWLDVQANPGGDGISVYFRDITDRKKNEEHLTYLANYDALTGLPNRVLLQDRLAQTLSRAPWHDRHIAVLFCDLDRFKLVNDTLGHNIGDHLLKKMAGRLQTCVRDGDTVARLGGDEFVILLTDLAAASDVDALAQKIVQSASEPFVLEGHEVFVGASVGISVYPDDGTTPELLLKHADVAMYEVKVKGKNGYQFYSSVLETKSTDRLSLESALRRALLQDEFELHYQPQVDLRSGRIVGAEALIRWQNPELGFVSPAEFLPLAEETGIIIPIGEWVLNMAVQQNKSWQDAGYPRIKMAVNLSNRQFHHNDLLELVEKTLRTHQLDPRWLELELTENILIDNTQQVLTLLQNLRDLGVELSIDDFGTGYTSLTYLNRFPINTLKIDRSFVNQISENDEDTAIIEAIIAMAKKLKLSVIAEGVETEAQRQFLTNHHCDQMQGFLFSRPVKAKDFTELLIAMAPDPE